jgi:hypothetical protein
MNNSVDPSNTQERQEVEFWLRWVSTVLGVVLIVSVLIIVALHVSNKQLYLKPADIEAALLFGFGILLIALFNFPWAKIRIGDLEIERAIE